MTRPIGEPLDWQPPARPAPVTLEGRYTRLVPLDPTRHGDDLAQASSDPDGKLGLWDYLGAGPFADRAGIDSWLSAAAAGGDAAFFAIMDRGNGQALGWASLMRIVPADGVIEVGNILFGPELQRSRLATEAIYLLARYVFETLGYRRFEWKCNALNAPSRRAAERFGFRYEGLFRQHMVVKGRNRDTAWYAITSQDWPAVRRGFERWLEPGNFDPTGRQRQTLAAARNEASSETPDREASDDVAAIDRLLSIMARLRDPNLGCPWDLEQSPRSIARYAIEEAYELVDAIERTDIPAIRDELGDLLLQVVFHARMAEEAGHFSFDDVAASIADKMVRRHPHVFGAGAEPGTAERQTEAWEQQKAAERQARAGEEGAAPSLLDNVPPTLPALTRALKLQARAARVGFDWPDAAQVLAKLEEEVAELRAEIDAVPANFPGGEAERADRMEDELGDVLFAAANLARKLSLDPETALRRANGKFTRRFTRIEQILAAEATPIESVGLKRLEELWQQAKAEER